MRKAILAGALFIGLICLYVGTAEALSLMASEDLTLAIPNQALGLGPNATHAPKVRLARYGQVFPLTVSGYVSGSDGYVNCQIPTGMTAGHYTLWVKRGGNWVKVNTLVKVLAPVVNQVTVTGNSIQSAADVTIQGLFFTESPTVTVSYASTANGTSLSAPCTVVGSSTVMDAQTGESQLQVQIPDLGSNSPTSCVFTVQSGNGTGLFYYSPSPGPIRGTLAGVTLQNTIPKKKVWNYLLNVLAGDDLFMHLATNAILRWTDLWDQEYHYDLKEYNITYWTVDTNNVLVRASGVVLVPQGKTTVPLLSFQHGTMLMKKEAPTLSEGAEKAFAVTFAAADGYLTAVPDHLGLGQATYRDQMDLTHPYCQAAPLAKPDADMLLAMKSFAAQQYPSVQLKTELFLTGYSEGGYATMALHRELDTNDYGLPPVTAAAYMDGPYSLSNAMLAKLMENAVFPVPYFEPYMLVELDKTYNIYGDASAYMKFPYDQTVAPLINGYFSEDTVNSMMPPSGVPSDLLLESVVSQLKQSTGPIYNYLYTNDLVPAAPLQGSWAPKAPVDVIHGKKDDCVPYTNLTCALDYFTAVSAPKVTNGTFSSIIAESIPFTTYHVAYCPFAMGMSWKWFHDMNP